MQLVVGRIARPHGVRGEVSVEVRTDDPGRRFAVGEVLATDPVAAGPLTVESARWHTGRLLISFAGITDRDQADELRGVWLTMDSAEVSSPEDPALKAWRKPRKAKRPTSGSSVAVCQVWPPSAETSTVRMPLPLSQAMPFTSTWAPGLTL